MYQYGLVKTKIALLPRIDKHNINLRSILPEVFRKKDILNSLIKPIRKPPYQSFPMNNVVGLRPTACSFIKKETPT